MREVIQEWRCLGGLWKKVGDVEWEERINGYRAIDYQVGTYLLIMVGPSKGVTKYRILGEKIER